MALFGYGMQRGLRIELPLPGFEGTYLDWTAPGIIAMGMLFTSIFTGMAILFERQFGFLKEILVAPVNRASFVLGKGLGGMTTAVLQGLTMFLLAILVFGLRITNPAGPLSGLAVGLAAMALLGLGIVNLGVAIAARLESHEVFMLVANFLVMPMFFLSGAIYPVANLPTAMQVVIALNPVHYAVDALRHALFGGGAAENSLGLDLAALALFAFVTQLAATRLFSRA
jgi:ABC-2 type transport system permease protein